jgi:N-acetyl-gamma-glutamyl-phosphate reductase
MVDNPNTLVIDASTAFRTHADWAYGLPELRPSQRDAIRKSKRVAVPGCHATAFVLPLRPLISAEILPPNTPIHSFSITGYSGGGKKMIAEYEQAAQGGGNHKFTSPRQYALGLMHKHLPEMKAHTGLANVPIFTPVVSNFYKGLAVTTYLHPQIIGTTLADIQSCIANYYANEPLIRVLPLGEENTDNGYFDVQACNDTNRVDIFVFGNDERAILIARLDNLGKGASGAAVQCMNVHLGLDDGYCI